MPTVGTPSPHTHPNYASMVCVCKGEYNFNLLDPFNVYGMLLLPEVARNPGVEPCCCIHLTLTVSSFL